MVGEPPRQPTAVLVVSAWREGAPPRLAARITYTLDATQRNRVTVTAAGIDEIDAVVRSWLREAEAYRTGDAPVTEQ
jgi:nuclear transport factor 2 (NTF2) superfamily protein